LPSWPPGAGYQNWAHGEPNNYRGNEQCGVIDKITGKWNDINCESRFSFICERGA